MQHFSHQLYFYLQFKLSKFITLSSTMSSNNSSFKTNQTNKSDNDPRFTGKAHARTFLFVNDDFPPLPQLPFYCPYDNLDGKRDQTGKLLPRFQTRLEYEAWCKECSRQPLNDLELRHLGKRWAEEAELTRLQTGCRNYLDYLEAQWWDTC